jgi:hypothetical protein
MKSTSRLLITTPSHWGDKVLRIGVRLGLFHPDGVTDHQAVYGKAQMENLLENTGLCLAQSHTFLFGTNQLFVCQRVDSQCDTLSLSH